MENNSISDVDGDINYRRRLLPIATAQSSTGEYTRSIFQVVTIALLVSWVAAVLFVPYLGEKLLPDFTKTGHQAPWYVRLWARITKTATANCGHFTGPPLRSLSIEFLFTFSENGRVLCDLP